MSHYSSSAKAHYNEIRASWMMLALLALGHWMENTRRLVHALVQKFRLSTFRGQTEIRIPLKCQLRQSVACVGR
ncbi:hypothetical protein [Burkholderia pseudomultivorans]|uniref:hypothetical protein n=1 Tax=Burkholderia pseudomultivorans TaxID=1207504 RepID=UPI000AFC4B22|nr:hypothetical protein [Burkholderia pseudomultivorans]